MPYANKGINTDVSEHGPVDKWGVVATNEINAMESYYLFTFQKLLYFYMEQALKKPYILITR